MNEERLKEMRNLLVLNPDDELSDFLTHTDLIDLIDELLSLRKSEGDEDVALIAERFQCGETEFHKIQAYKDLEGVAIARGQQLREAKRREQIMAHHCQKYVEMTWEQAEAAYDAAEPVEISREEIDRIVGLVLAMNDEELEEKDLRQQLRAAQAEVERLKGELAEVVGRLVWMHKTFSGTDEYRYLKEDGHREIGRIELAVKNQLEIVAASDGKSGSEVGR